MVLSVNERNFSQEVLNSSIPVLVSFWAPWCGVCRLVNPFLLRLQAEWNTPLKIVSINADENFKLTTAYRLTTLPTVLLFHNGNLVHRLDGFSNRDQLRLAVENLQQVLESIQEDVACPV